MDTRDSKGRFLPGNPGGGRPKKKPTTLDILRELSPQAVTCLEDLIHSEDEDIVLRASIAVLELSLKYDKKNITSDDILRDIFLTLDDTPIPDLTPRERVKVFKVAMQQLAKSCGIHGHWNDCIDYMDI